MKAFLPLILIFILASCVTSQNRANYVPTPEMAITFGFGEDTRKWKIQNMDGNSTQIVIEMVPDGQNIKSWKEMVAQQIVFTPLELDDFINNWLSGLYIADPNATILDKTKLNNSVTVQYESLSAKEIGIRKFTKAGDGIYMYAYHVRPESFDKKIYDFWLSNISASTLIANPAKR